MNVDVVSDLHIEWWDKRWLRMEVPETAGTPWDALAPRQGRNVLVVAGDVANSVEGTVLELREACQHWPWVAAVDGNHEHYGAMGEHRTVEQGIRWMREQTADLANLRWLDPQDAWRVPGTGVWLAGCNGWYDLRSAVGTPPEAQRAAWERCITDARQIDFGGRPPDERARRDAYRLRRTLEALGRGVDVEAVVAVTHTVPGTGRDLQGPYGDPKHRDQVLNGAFCNAWMQGGSGRLLPPPPKVALWCYGHTHTAIDAVRGNTRFVCNPRGYGGEGRGVYKAVRVRVPPHRTGRESSA